MVGLHERVARAGGTFHGGRLARLTDRERETADLVAVGLTNAEIGRQLGLAPASVKANVSRVLDKLGVTNRVQIALLVRDAGDPSEKS